ncbi:MAG: hypothetical protein FWG49_01105, partial [Leptospirales bacterium]|nr:hypothetical protein [Leptospirales bacterium]
MDLSNKSIADKSNSFSNDFKEKVKLRVSDKFDISIIGKIDLVEAEKIAKEEVFFLTENDIIEGLEDFKLVPPKSKEYLKDEVIQETENPAEIRDAIKVKYSQPIIEIDE